MPHTGSLPVLIVDHLPFHQHARQRHPHEIWIGAIEGTLIESRADFCLVAATDKHGAIRSGVSNFDMACSVGTSPCDQDEAVRL
jgi:hypothetical protein